jgi:hypothetical protein
MSVCESVNVSMTEKAPAPYSYAVMHRGHSEASIHKHCTGNCDDQAHSSLHLRSTHNIAIFSWKTTAIPSNRKVAFVHLASTAPSLAQSRAQSRFKAAISGPPVKNATGPARPNRPTLTRMPSPAGARGRRRGGRRRGRPRTCEGPP